MDGCWSDIIKAPNGGRLKKPRKSGITMVIDKGLSIAETESLLDSSAPYIDFLKLSFGTAALYDKSTLSNKIKLTKEYEVAVYPGGTFLEIAYWQGKSIEYFKRLVELGINWVEISDGTISISQLERTRLIMAAAKTGLKIITEVGKKDLHNQPSEASLIETANHDLNLGVEMVIIEARESGKGIGIYDSSGEVNNTKLEAIKSGLPLEKIIWEAPLKNQQATLINSFGPNVNLGNIAPTETLSLEALRLGFRSDTWKPN